MPGCARLMNIQRRRLAPARLPHFRPDPQPLPTGEGRGWRKAAEAHYLPGGPNHLDSRGGVVSGRCNSLGQRRLPVGAAQASLLPRSAHVAVKPEPSHTPDRDII
ncbi:unnamed protein product [Rangifer tarandus platyrhynchus]|uniref:Uncharacterized protein n=1 Tax=Rangifer tarandus platyrhynchus TaxID=3082113 RepID=A0ABN8ZDB1_RANTA|nr:unnamed protein product [Rangifer tarandus platyrhynchus]CAI9688953.1 unnamed protein product [Rangifer tarandus platyrhynchus]